MLVGRTYNRGMPTYEYACLSCGHHIEVFQRFSDEALTKCGVCGGPLRKVFHPAGILFKGSGFYSTDSRKKPSDGSSKKESESTSTEKKTKSDTAATSDSKGGSASSSSGSGSSSGDRS